MFSSTAAATATAMTGAPQRTQVTIGFVGRFAGSEWGQSEEHRSFWESPQRGASKAAQGKRACKGGREVRIRVSDGPAMDRSGRLCGIVVATGPMQRARAERAGCSTNRMGDFKRAG